MTDSARASNEMVTQFIGIALRARLSLSRRASDRPRDDADNDSALGDARFIFGLPASRLRPAEPQWH
jgi:hypothetical protein